MSIPKISGFNVSAPQPIDTRIIATSSSVRINMNYLVVYDGLKVFQTDIRKTYVFNGAKFLSSGGTQSAVSTSWDEDNGGGVLQYSSISAFPTASNASPNILYVDQTSNLSYYWSTQSSTYSCTVDIFTYNPTVYLGPSYSFGRYTNGSVIPAIGKTPQQVILDAIQQPLTPTANISVIPTTIPYNTSSIIATISVSYTINSAGATAAVGTVSYGTSTPNTFLTNKVGPTATYTNTFTQSVNYTALPVTPINYFYKYDVTDTQGAEANSIGVINMTPYAQPTITLTQSISNPQSIESSFVREIGNVGTTLSSTSISINSPLVPLRYYQLSYSNDGTNYYNIGSTISITSGAISPTFSSALSTSTTIGYFGIILNDAKQSSSRFVTSVINFYYPYFVVVSTTNYNMTQIINDVTSSTCAFLTKHLYINNDTINVNTMGVTGYLFLVVPTIYPKTNWRSSASNGGPIGGNGTFQSYTTTSINDGYCNIAYNIYYNIGTPLTFDQSTNNYAFS